MASATTRLDGFQANVSRGTVCVYPSEEVPFQVEDHRHIAHRSEHLELWC